MPRYMAERKFPGGLAIPSNRHGRDTTAKVAAKNSKVSVTWVQSYVTTDNRETHSIYDGPNEDAIRNAAERNGLPVDSSTPVKGLDPYFYNVQA